MLGFFSIVAVLLSALFVAIADAMIKQTTLSGSFLSALLSPWMLAICGLYFAQILLAFYVFIHRGDLAIYGMAFNVFYSVLMILLGVFIFKEHVTLWQGVGIVLALGGTILLNSGL